LDNADHFVKQFISTFLKLFQTKLLVMLENNSCYSDVNKIYLTLIQRKVKISAKASKRYVK